MTSGWRKKFHCIQFRLYISLGNLENQPGYGLGVRQLSLCSDLVLQWRDPRFHSVVVTPPIILLTDRRRVYSERGAGLHTVRFVVMNRSFVILTAACQLPTTSMWHSIVLKILIVSKHNCK